MLHHDDDFLDPRDQVHRAAHAFDHFAGDHPIGDVAIFGNLHRPQNCQVYMPAADHGKGRGAVEIGRLRQFANRLLARVNQVRVHLVIIGKWPNTQHAVFRL